MQVTGAEVFVKALLCEKVDTLFAYPGGQVIDLFNALYGVEGIDVILPRHEQGLIHAADGYARSTGKVGVCLVTSEPEPSEKHFASPGRGGRELWWWICRRISSRLRGVTRIRGSWGMVWMPGVKKDWRWKEETEKDTV